MGPVTVGELATGQEGVSLRCRIGALLGAPEIMCASAPTILPDLCLEGQLAVVRPSPTLDSAGDA